MSVLANKHSPVLGRIWIFVDLLRDHLTQACLFGKPFASQASNRMPANLDRSSLAVKNRFCDRHCIWCVSEPSGPFQG